MSNQNLLVKLLSPETANIKNIFNNKTLLYNKVVRDRNNVVAKENSAVCVCRGQLYLTHKEEWTPTSMSSYQEDTYPLHQVPSTNSFPNSSSLSSNIPSAMRTMASDAEDILDSIMGEMRTNPVANIEEEFLENNLMRLDTLMKMEADFKIYKLEMPIRKPSSLLLLLLPRLPLLPHLPLLHVQGLDLLGYVPSKTKPHNSRLGIRLLMMFTLKHV